MVPHVSELRKSLGFSKNLRRLEDSLGSGREGLEPRHPLRLSISIVSTANSLCQFSILSVTNYSKFIDITRLLSYSAVDQKSFPCLMAHFPPPSKPATHDNFFSRYHPFGFLLHGRVFLFCVKDLCEYIGLSRTIQDNLFKCN